MKLQIQREAAILSYSNPHPLCGLPSPYDGFKPSSSSPICSSKSLKYSNLRILPVPLRKPLRQSIHLMLPVVTPNVSINTPTPFQLYSKTLTSHEIPCPRGIVCKNDFQIQPLFLVLTFQIKYQDPIQHDTTLKLPN